MAYNRSIPQPTDLISNSQPSLLANFQAIDSGTTGTGAGFSRNHVTLTDSTNGGLHNRVDYYQAVSSPSISGFISSLYPKTVTHVELFYKNGTQDMQISNSLLTAASGEGMLPGGLQLRMVTGLTLTADNSTHTFTISPAFPNNILIAIPVPGTTDVTNSIQYIVASSNASTAAFKCNNGGSVNFGYLAIGY